MDRSHSCTTWHERGSAAGSARGRAVGDGAQRPAERVAVFMVRRDAIWRRRRGAGRGAGNLVGPAASLVFRVARGHEIVALRISLGGGTAKLLRRAVYGGTEFSEVIPKVRLRTEGGSVSMLSGKVWFSGGLDLGADECRPITLLGWSSETSVETSNGSGYGASQKEGLRHEEAGKRVALGGDTGGV